MKILIIDPRCVEGSNLYDYTMGLAEGISTYADTTVISVRKCRVLVGKKFKVLRMFYPISESLGRGKIRQLIRGIEYIITYLTIWLMTIPKQYDVIHIEWPIIYKLDPFIFKLLKRHCKVLSLKAHNILPHSTDNEWVREFDNIYSIPDVVFVHGEKIKDEFIFKFPKYRPKVQIQRHGIFLNKKMDINFSQISREVIDKISSHERIYLFFGRIDQDKGLDRLVKIWDNNFKNSKSLLVIAGAVNESYKEFVEVESIIMKNANILYLPGYANEDLMRYLFEKCNLIILPYIKGSMSGVAFSAAAYERPILATKFGSIEEYIENGVTGFVVDNDSAALEQALLEIDEHLRNKELMKVGINMKSFFEKEYDWNIIGKKMIAHFQILIGEKDCAYKVEN